MSFPFKINYRKKKDIRKYQSKKKNYFVSLFIIIMMFTNIAVKMKNADFSWLGAPTAVWWNLLGFTCICR